MALHVVTIILGHAAKQLRIYVKNRDHKIQQIENRADFYEFVSNLATVALDSL